MTSPAASLVIPAYEEGQRIVPVLDRIFGCVQSSIEVLVVYDTDDDSTAPVLSEYAESESRLQPTLNTYGRGPAHAIRYGIDMSSLLSPWLMGVMTQRTSTR
jgi:glycosyltransferase involved in cell wall biosynthesis